MGDLPTGGPMWNTTIEHHTHNHYTDPEVLRRLVRMELALITIAKGVLKLAEVDFQPLEEALAENESADSSAEQLLDTIVQQLEEIANQDRATISSSVLAYAGRLRDANSRLSAAVIRNTPADPNPDPEIPPA